MEICRRASTIVYENSPTVLSKTLPTPASDSSMNDTAPHAKAPGETLASDEPPLDPKDINSSKTIFDFQVLNCFYELYDLAQHKGSVVMICNVASKDKEYTEAGYTMLTKLYHKHRMEGFVVLAFPCNEFGNGEPGNEEEIAENISCMYPHIGEVDFPIMAKVDVNGDHASPLFTFLKSRIRDTLSQTSIKWNFTAFLCDQTGAPFARFAPESPMAEIETRVDELLHPKRPLAAASDAHPQPPPQELLENVESAVETAAVEDMPTLDGFSTCATLPPSGVPQRNVNWAEPDDEAITAIFLPPLLVATTTVTDVTLRGSPLVNKETEEEHGSAMGNESMTSTLFDKTTNTLEGSNS